MAKQKVEAVKQEQVDFERKKLEKENEVSVWMKTLKTKSFYHVFLLQEFILAQQFIKIYEYFWKLSAKKIIT